MSHPHIVLVGWKLIDKSTFGGYADENRISRQARQKAVVIAGAMPQSSAAPVEQHTGNQYGTDLIERELRRVGDRLLIAPSVSLHLDIGSMHGQSPVRPCAGNRAPVLVKKRVEVDLPRHWSEGEHVGGV